MKNEKSGQFCNCSKINAYQRQKYHERKNKTKEKNEDIKKDVEKLKEKFRLLHGCNKNVTVIIFIN